MICKSCKTEDITVSKADGLCNSCAPPFNISYSPEHTLEVSGGYKIYEPDKYNCPKCGVVTNYIQVEQGDPCLDGKYCQKCWVRWMKEFVPRVTPL